MSARKKTSSPKDSTATIGFESRPCGIWLTADKLRNNMDGYVHANGPAIAGYSNQSGEGDIRRALIEADLVDCMVALSGQIFGSNTERLRWN